MAGIDEASARSVLADMQARLASDPASALGITLNATAEDLRSAFLQLTKRFHPVRFGRMAIDIQKQSNEVFLALRAAHDAVARSLRSRSGPIASTRASGSALNHASGTTPVSASAGAAAPAASPSHPLALAAPAPGTSPPPGRTAPKLGRPASPSDTGERAQVPSGSPLPVPPVPSAGLKVPPSRPAAPQAAPRALRPVGSAPATSPRDEGTILDLLQRQQWDQARSALHQLSARDPSSKRIRALMCYARGREAQLGGQVDDARVELQDALDLDPDLQVAKTALTELFTRRK